MSRIGCFALLALAALAAPPRALACTCIQPGPACQAFWTTDAAFDGSVTAITPVERTDTIGDREFRMTEKRVEFAVRQAWKGVDAGPVQILTTESGGLCGFDFEVGRRYLVFSHRRPADGRLGVSRCSLTREYNGFSSDITPFLAALAAPHSASGGRVFGTVRLGPGRLRDGEPAPMSVQVRLTGDGRTVTTASEGGRYEFTDVKPARYEIDVTLPPGYSSQGFPRAVTIADPRACAQEDAWVTPAGRILGRVVNPSGAAVGSVQIDLVRAGTQPGARAESPAVYERTLPDGTFEFTGLAPGRYVAGVNVQGPPTPSNRYEPVLYPGQGQDGEVAVLALGQTLDLGTLRLPAPLRVINAIGTITWQDGTPAANFPVVAQDVRADGRRFAGSSARSGPDGRFTIALLEGRTYTLSTPEFGPRDQIKLAVPPFRAQESMAPVTVVIPRVRRQRPPVE